MKIESSRQTFIEQTDIQMKVCISWAPVGAKNKNTLANHNIPFEDNHTMRGMEVKRLSK